jgi:hypothetical protein
MNSEAVDANVANGGGRQERLEGQNLPANSKNPMNCNVDEKVDAWQSYENSLEHLDYV